MLNQAVGLPPLKKRSRRQAILNGCLILLQLPEFLLALLQLRVNVSLFSLGLSEFIFRSDSIGQQVRTCVLWVSVVPPG